MTASVAPTHSTPVFWNRTVVRTRVLDSLSLMLPAAEVFLIDTLAQWQAQEGDSLEPTMRQEVARFIREEQSHQRAHHRYNDALIAANPAVLPVAQRAAHVADELSGLSLKTKMALAAAFEHLTTVLSHELLNNSFLMDKDSTCVQAQMWRWHAKEEMAHSHVMIQAAALAGVGRIRRMAALGLASVYLASDVLRYTWALCRCDMQAGASRGGLLVDAMKCAVGSVPTLARMALGCLRYPGH